MKERTVTVPHGGEFGRRSGQRPFLAMLPCLLDYWDSKPSNSEPPLFESGSIIGISVKK
jgi:hypothetical protein